LTRPKVFMVAVNYIAFLEKKIQKMQGEKSRVPSTPMEEDSGPTDATLKSLRHKVLSTTALMEEDSGLTDLTLDSLTHTVPGTTAPMEHLH
jgi:hypothetical protein